MVTNSKAVLLRLHETGSEPIVFTWVETREIWAKRTLSDKQNLFSRVGIGARSALFEVRGLGDLTMHDAILWKGEHHFITRVEQLGPTAAEVNTAIVTPVPCTAKGLRTTLGALNRPVQTDIALASFPGILTGKYAGWAQGKPEAYVDVTMVLVTPKPVLLEIGDRVDIGGTTYHVRVPHLLDAYKNEYEIAVRVEA